MTRRSLLEIPSGVQCFFGKEARLRRDVERAAAEVFRGWSYEEIVLPLFDFDDVFTRGGGATAPGGIYRFIGRDGEVMALRPDFTALVAKVFVSRLSRHELPLRLFYSGEVLRYQPPRAGQQEELFQIGLEHLGSGETKADVEVLLVAIEALSRLGIDDAVTTIGHAGVALGLLDDARDAATRAETLESMRRHDRAEIRRTLGAERADLWFELMTLSGGLEVLSEARKIRGLEPRALARIDRIARCFTELGLSDRLRVDLGEVRGFEYYTGLVFDIHASGSGLELGGGGRYDSLIGRFGRDVPAVGFSLSLDRIAELLVRRGWSAPEEEVLVLKEAGEPEEVLSRALGARREGRKVRVQEP